MKPYDLTEVEKVSQKELKRIKDHNFWVCFVVNDGLLFYGSVFQQ